MKVELTKKEWQQFTTLLIRIVDSDMPVDEKAKLVLEKVKEHGGEEGAMSLEDFVAWDFGEF